MADEKKYSAREAAVAVLKKAEEMIKSSELMKKGVDQYDNQVHQKGVQHGIPSRSNAGTAHSHSESMQGHHVRTGNIESAKNQAKKTIAQLAQQPKPNLTKADETPSDNVEQTPDPRTNPKEIAENGNPAPGALPQNEEKYSAEMKGHIKLAKFVGGMEKKRASKGPANG